MTKTAKRFFLALWAIAFLVPAIAGSLAGKTPWTRFAPFPKRSENRKPAVKPSLRRKSSRHVAPHAYGAAMEAWYSDSFPWRTELIAFHRRISFDVLKTPVGRDVPGYGNWIFRRGGDWAELDDYLGAFELTTQELDDWVSLFEGRGEWARAIGSHFITFPAPVKAQCRWQEMFPAIRRHRGRNVASQVEAALGKSHAKDDVLFAAPAFAAAFAAGRETFFDFDHHPTAYGLWLLYDALNRRLAEIFPGRVGPSFPWFDDPPQEVREGKSPGCWLEEKEPHYRMVVSSPGETEDDNGVPHDASRYPFCNVATVRDGGGISIAMAHDSYMRFSLASWRGKDGDVRFPFAEGVGRVRAWIFGRTNWGFLQNITKNAIPDVIIEQFPECRLDGTAHRYLSPALRAAALYAHSAEPPDASAPPPPGSRVAVRIIADGLAADSPGTPRIVLHAGTNAIATEKMPPGVKRAVFFDVEIPDGTPTALSASVAGGHAAALHLDWRLAGK